MTAADPPSGTAPRVDAPAKVNLYLHVVGRRTDGLHLLDSLVAFAGVGDAIDAALREHGAVGAIAQPLFTEYVVPFELTGILLLVAIVGALVLAKKAS